MTRARKTLRTPGQLADAGLMPHGVVASLERVALRYAVAITPDVAALIDPGDANDPIARQFLPDVRELDQRPEERADPIGDIEHEAVPGVVHRYPDRVLLKLTHVCPVYCRFCFRREMVGPGGEALTAQALDTAIDYITRNNRIVEVIMTGGDPLMLAPRRIAEVTRRLSEIAHVRVLRWHSRVPVVDPNRVTPELVEALKCERAVYVGIHTNHPRELTEAARAAIARMADARLVLVSQTVLLRDVNDDAATLAELFTELVALRVKPYYLHHADLAPGTAHFRTSIAEGQAIMRTLRGRISGLALPTYILDVPDGFGKVPAGPQYVDADAPVPSVTDVHGAVHAYPPGDARR
ncbi:MAG: lysine-2,3-aminomutase-like protein [Rhodospirillales bacterium]|nr:lysine-2,3-aminomutase-like protein [Rhodospirillales bacterium]